MIRNMGNAWSLALRNIIPIVLLLATGILWVWQPRGVPAGVDAVVAPAFVNVPVLKKTVVAGGPILPDDIHQKRFTRAELAGKITTATDVEYTIALREISSDELIPSDAVEHFVMVPMTSRPLDAGTILTNTCGIDLQPVRVSRVDDTRVVDTQSWLNKKVVHPLEAHVTIPADSLADAENATKPTCETAQPTGQPKSP